MIAYQTTYEQNGLIYYSELIGKNKQEVLVQIELRSIGEELSNRIPVEKCPTFEIKTLPELIHYCTFLSYIAIKSGIASTEEVLGDMGVLHELIHLMTGTATHDTKETIHEKVEWLFTVTFATYPFGRVKNLLFSKIEI